MVTNINNWLGLMKEENSRKGAKEWGGGGRGVYEDHVGAQKEL